MLDLVVQIENVNGKNVVSSRVIAQQLGKRHADVVGKIREVLTEREYLLDYYIDSSGKRNIEYFVTKDGLGAYLSSLRTLKNNIPDTLLEFADMKQIHTYTRFEISFINIFFSL